MYSEQQNAKMLTAHRSRGQVTRHDKAILTYHPLTRPSRFSPATVFEWADRKISPFPSMEMQKEFQGTFGMTIDKQNRIWFIEPASFDFEHTRL